MKTTTFDLMGLYKVRKGALDIVEIPDLGIVAVDGSGAPEGPGFAAALQALYGVTYGAHFIVKKRDGDAPRVMPLEAMWWVDDPDQQDIVAAVAFGTATMADTDRDAWRWRAFIVQPEPVDSGVVAEAVALTRAKHPSDALDRLAYVRFEEGRCAQVLHLGPYAEEGPTIVRLHDGIRAAGLEPCGRHHEIYLGDPRRCAPERLRTILRHPVRAAG